MTVKFSWKGLSIVLGLSILIFLHVLMGIYVYANIADYKIDFLNLNPSEKGNVRNFPFMTYPLPNGSGLQITSATIIFENFQLTYNGTAAENQPFELSAMATLNPALAAEIESISLYFEGAVPYPVKSGSQYSGGWGVSLRPAVVNGRVAISLGAFLLAESTVITWQVQGDYYPSISIHFSNFTNVPQSYEGYQDFRVHIESADVLKQQASSRINTSISEALVFFAFVDGSVLVGRFLLTRKRKRQRKPKPTDSRKTDNNSEQQPTNKPESKTD